MLSPELLNDKLEVKHYFFDDIVKQGPLVYNTGRFSLAEMRRLEPEEYIELVKDDFEYWRKKADGAYDLYDYSLRKNDHDWAAFNLHQAVECSSVMVDWSTCGTEAKPMISTNS